MLFVNDLEGHGFSRADKPEGKAALATEPAAAARSRLCKSGLEPSSKIAACTVLLMSGLSLVDFRNELDMPHLHVDDPIIPITAAATYAPATNTASIALPSLSWSTGP